MKRIIEQSSVNPPKATVNVIDEDPNLSSIKKFCNFQGSFEGYTMTTHPDTKKAVWGKPRKDSSGINYIYVDDSGDVKLEKRNTENKVLTNKVWGDCQNVLAVTPDMKSVINAIIANDKTYTNVFPGAGKIGPGREYTAVDVEATPQGKSSGLFKTGMHFIYKKTGSQTVNQDQITNIEKELGLAGYTLIEPTDESLLNTGRKISQVLGPKYSKYYSEKGQPEPMVYKTTVMSEQKRSECKNSIKKLYKAFTNPSYPGITTASERILLKDTVHWCKFNMKFISGALGVKDELDELFTKGESQGNAFGMRGYEPVNTNPLKESTVKLKNLIKENLIIAKENKKRVLTEEIKIVKTRLIIISENRVLKTKKQKDKFNNELLSEMIYFNKQGFNKELINEQFWDVLKGIFGNGAEGIMGTFKEYIGSWLVDNLTPIEPDGWLGQLIITSVGNLDITDIGKLTNCDYLTKFLAKNISETMVKKLQVGADMRNPLFDVMRNAIVETMEESALGQKIEKGLVEIICPLLSGVKSKMDTATDKLKQGAISAAN